MPPSSVSRQPVPLSNADVSLKEYVEKLMDERDKRLLSIIDERDRQYADARRANETAVQAALVAQEKATSTALAAQEKATASAFSSSEKAIDKADSAYESRFECVSSDTLILCSDLTWKQAGQLSIGDELIALDEESTTRSGRRFRRSVVTDNSLAQDELFLVNTSTESVRCNANHPWLTRRHAWQWVKTSDLQVGDEVSYPVDTWKTDLSWESGWLAGLFDGEGCLSVGNSVGKLRTQLSLSQRESPTSDRIFQELRKRLGKKPLVYRYEPGTPSTPNNTQPFFHFLIVKRSDIMKLLGSVRPPRLLDRASAVWEGKVIAGDKRLAVVSSIDPVGTGTIARLSTSTGTYIAGGFAMHNSVNEFRAQLGDQQRTFMPRAEVELLMTSINGRMNAIDKLQTEAVSQKAGGINLWATILGVLGGVGIILTIAARFIP